MKVRFGGIEELTLSERDSMQALLALHFTGVDPRSFADDLANKTHAVRLFADDGALAGFTTIDYRRQRIDDADRAVIYSGDTIVDPSAWSTASLGSAWVAAVLDLHLRQGPAVPLWWLLLTSGMRTHRYLSMCCRRFEPAPEGRDDAEAERLLPRLAADRFGPRYDPVTGIVRLSNPQALRPHLLAVPAHVCEDPHARFFLARNPGHAQGDELVSLCRLDEDNLTRAGLRALALGRQSLAKACA